MEHERVTLHEDGGATLRLSEPVTVAGHVYREVTVKPKMRGRDYRAMGEGRTGEEKQLSLTASMGQVPLAVLEDMVSDDIWLLFALVDERTRDPFVK
jgi:hypothetical protein